MAELLDRAQALLAAGPYDARPAEIAAVHDAIWPEKAPVCPTLMCRRVLGVAYYAIQRWVSQQDTSSTNPPSTTVKKSAIRFKSDSTIYTPHGLGIAYSNANITPKAARDIVAGDPDAAALFEGLEAEDDSDTSDTDTDVTTSDAANQDDKPASLSRMTKEQLVHAYRTELGLEPKPEAHNDELRKAIADHRAAQA